MYELFFGLREAPFSLLPDASFLYLSKKHDRALTLLRYALTRRAGFAVLTGDIGSGKTTLIRVLLEEMEDETTIGLVTNTHASFGELLQWILLSLGIERQSENRVSSYRAFTDFLICEYSQNRRTTLIIDEAQNMSSETLEELRLLSNVNTDKDHLLQFVLVGQPELRATLRLPSLVQFRQRIAVGYHLEPLDFDETVYYVRHRLRVAGGGRKRFFNPECYPAIYRYSRGVPRLINTICDTALVYAYGARRKVVRSGLLAEVVRNLEAGGLFDSPEGYQAGDGNPNDELVGEDVPEEKHRGGVFHHASGPFKRSGG